MSGEICVYYAVNYTMSTASCQKGVSTKWPIQRWLHSHVYLVWHTCTVRAHTPRRNSLYHCVQQHYALALCPTRMTYTPLFFVRSNIPGYASMPIRPSGMMPSICSQLRHVLFKCWNVVTWIFNSMNLLNNPSITVFSLLKLSHIAAACFCSWCYNFSATVGKWCSTEIYPGDNWIQSLLTYSACFHNHTEPQRPATNVQGVCNLYRIN